MFTNLSDTAVVEQMNRQFEIITGISLPKAKTDSPPIPHEQFGFINLMVFQAAFVEAEKRGLLNPAEIVAGNEVLAIIGD